MDSTSPFSPVSPLTQNSASSPQEGVHPYTTPAHEGLQAVDQPPEAPRQGPYSYQGQIQPDVVPLSVLNDKYNDDHLLPSYPDRRILGLTVRMFWMVVAVVILLVVVAIGVGAGVGVSQASKHSNDTKNAEMSSSSMLPSSTAASAATQSSSAASTPASSSSASSTASSTGTALVGATPVPISGILPLDCPNIDGSTYSTSSSNIASFKISCSSTIDSTGSDMGRTFAPSLDGCIEFCATKTTGCLAVVFNANLTLSNPLDGNCYFKNTTQGLHTGSYSLQATAISA